MADNFDLRQFLTENKLTKNAKLLSEAVTLGGKPVDVGSIEIDGIDTSDYPDFVDAYITYAEFEDGTPLSEDELMRLEDENYGIVGELIFDKQLYLEGKEVEEGIQSQPGLEGVNYGSIEIDGVDSNDYPDFVDAYVAYAEFEDGTPLSEEELYQLTDELYESGELADMAAESLYEGKEKELKEGKSYKVSKNSKEAQHLKKGDIIGSGDEVVSVSAGAKTPSGKVEVTLKTKDGKTKTSTWGKTTKVGVKEKETVKENKMTQRDKYLTRLVENALGLEGYGDDNVNRQREKQGLPPAQGPKYSEGITEDEMVEEKPLPKYENIEKLMQEIDKNTDEEAHKFKVQEMKRVADMLEKKCTALEEGDDADHIDQKKLKQMKKDIMTLRKGMEKLEKLGEKKFTKKETKAELKEGFDLRKFLVENKLTSNSRLLSEADETLMGGIAKNLYLYLSKMKPNNPLDTNGQPLQNVKGEIIKNDPKVKMIYQNASTGLNNLAMQGKAKELEKSHQGNQNNAEITIWYTSNAINALGFVKKEEAEAALKVIVGKYPKEVTGTVNTNKMDYEWAKNYAPKYSIYITMKSDKELARTQSARPQVNELLGFGGGTKATEKDTIRIVVRGGSITFKPVVRGGTSVRIEQNDSDFDHIKVGNEIRIVKSFEITAGKPFYIGSTEVIVDKLFLNGTETKSVTLPK